MLHCCAQHKMCPVVADVQWSVFVFVGQNLSTAYKTLITLNKINISYRRSFALIRQLLRAMQQLLYHSTFHLGCGLGRA